MLAELATLPSRRAARRCILKFLFLRCFSYSPLDSLDLSFLLSPLVHEPVSLIDNLLPEWSGHVWKQFWLCLIDTLARRYPV